MRVIDVDETVIKELKRHKLYQNEVIMSHRSIYHNKDFIFTHLDDTTPGYPIILKK